MTQTPKKKILISAAAFLTVAVLMFFFVFRTQTGSHESRFSEATTADGFVSYTMPPNLTVQQADSITFTTPTETYVTSYESAFSFAGSCDGNYTLSCNGETIPVTDGLFTVEYVLSQGVNMFTFTYGSITKEFSVEYGIDIVRGVGPQGKTEAAAGTQIEILALAHKDAAVTAQIGGQTVALTATDRNAFTQSEGTRDYQTFAGLYTMPSLGQNTPLGNIVVTGVYGDKSETMTGGELYLIANNADIAARAAQIEQANNLVSFYANGNHGLYTAYVDSGNGAATICEILKDKTETTPASDSADYSDPQYSPLARGTFDYITSVVTYEDELMYVLASGRKVYAKDARLLSPGYTLPQNTLTASDAVSNGTTTDYYIRTAWAVPTSIALSPQGYYTGYQGRRYNVTAFTAQYLDITFYYTASAGGSFSVPNGDVVSSLQWINNGNNTVTLRCNLTRPGRYAGCSLSLTEDGRFKLSIRNINTGGKTVMLDPGHGGSDQGAPGIYPGVYESAVNLSIAGKVAAILQQQGVQVLMTRTSDADVSLNDRMRSARQYMPDAFVSIHSDSSSSAASSGTHTFYYYSQSMPLAASIHRQMVTVYKNNIYRQGTAEYEAVDKGIKFYPFQVTRVEECPSVLVECGFLSNVSDCSVLITDACQTVLATAIANGIIEYLNSIG